MNKNKKVTPTDLLDQENFSGIILSKKLLKSLGVEKHPWLKISISNEISKNGETINKDMIPVMVHENGWGFSVLDSKVESKKEKEKFDV
ncbi:MAG: hypothetical protein AAB361_00830 [Patescibacteria group bacterium]